ncbi:hypothetical protein K502DRAFT_346243 [Neoconidiobolus thromboides FSU 785]|nr:hypothetical protein K502DRAFT_346243 [Neoconidiobolus thromboides FSU 785]
MIPQSETSKSSRSMTRSSSMLFIKYYQVSFVPLKEYFIESKPDLLICSFFAHSRIDLVKRLSIPLVVSYQITDGIGLINKPFVTQEFKYHLIYIKKMFFIERFNYQIIKLIHQVPYVNGLNPGFNYGLNVANSFIGFEPAIILMPNLIHIS